MSHDSNPERFANNVANAGVRRGRGKAAVPRYSAGGREYDPALDGWNKHSLRRPPTVSELVAREDGFGEDF